MEALVVIQNLEKTLNRRGSNGSVSNSSPKNKNNENESAEEIEQRNTTNSFEILRYQQMISTVTLSIYLHKIALIFN